MTTDDTPSPLNVPEISGLSDMEVALRNHLIVLTNDLGVLIQTMADSHQHDNDMDFVEVCERWLK